MRKLKWICVIVSLVTVMLMGSLLAAPAFADHSSNGSNGEGHPSVHKVDICHVNGNGGVIEISVGSRSLAAHLAHGDSINIEGCL